MGALCATGEDCGACGASCGGGGAGSGGLSYVGGGQGSYVQETTYKYVGCGGDFDVMRPRRDFTCLIASCCLSLLLLPLLLWLLSGLGTTSLPFDCEKGFGNWEALWSMEQQDYCCTTSGRGCTTRPTTARPIHVADHGATNSVPHSSANSSSNGAANHPTNHPTNQSSA